MKNILTIWLHWHLWYFLSLHLQICIKWDKCVEAVCQNVAVVCMRCQWQRKKFKMLLPQITPIGQSCPVVIITGGVTKVSFTIALHVAVLFLDINGDHLLQLFVLTHSLNSFTYKCKLTHIERVKIFVTYSERCSLLRAPVRTRQFLAEFRRWEMRPNCCIKLWSRIMPK